MRIKKIFIEEFINYLIRHNISYKNLKYYYKDKELEYPDKYINAIANDKTNLRLSDRHMKIIMEELIRRSKDEGSINSNGC